MPANGVVAQIKLRRGRFQNGRLNLPQQNLHDEKTIPYPQLVTRSPECIQVLASDRLPRSEYNAGLKSRGSITFWLSTDVTDEWLVKTKTGSRGASKTYNDIAIATMSIVKSVFSLAGRQAQGFVESILQLMKINLPVPDHSTVSRRLGRLKIELPVEKSNCPRHLVVDSTGVKVYGEGEWKTRQHGISTHANMAKTAFGDR